jgi:hypothetical protein
VDCKIRTSSIVIKSNLMRYCYILILLNIFYVFRTMKLHHKEVSCRIQALWYNVMSKCVCVCVYIYSIMLNQQCVFEAAVDTQRCNSQ